MSMQLLLRATKECKVGDESFTHDILLACMTVKDAQDHGQKLIKASTPIKLEPSREEINLQPSARGAEFAP